MTLGGTLVFFFPFGQEELDEILRRELKITRAADTACQARNKRNKAPEYQ